MQVVHIYSVLVLVDYLHGASVSSKRYAVHSNTSLINGFNISQHALELRIGMLLKLTDPICGDMFVVLYITWKC